MEWTAGLEQKVVAYNKQQKDIKSTNKDKTKQTLQIFVVDRAFSKQLFKNNL